MLTIYHNPRCSKSRAGLNYLKAHNIEHNVVQYLKHPLQPDEIQALLHKLDMKPAEVIRTREDAYKQHVKGRKLSDEELINIIAAYPKLLRRPIVESNDKAVIAQPPEEIDKLF